MSSLSTSLGADNRRQRCTPQPLGASVIEGVVEWQLKGIGILRGTPIRIPNHRAPNHQLTISWWVWLNYIPEI